MEQTANPARLGSGRFQFRLWLLFLLVTTVAALCAVFHYDAEIAYFSAILVLVPTLAAFAIRFCLFAIGAAARTLMRCFERHA